MKEKIKVKIKSPYTLELAKDGDTGYDIKNNGEAQKIEPGKSAIFDSGVSIEMPKGLDCQVRGRSGLWFKRGVSIGQTGTIDSGYRGNIKVRLVNLSPMTYVVGRNERIAQLVFSQHEAPEFEDVFKLSESDRGNGGFGHTGR